MWSVVWRIEVENSSTSTTLLTYIFIDLDYCKHVTYSMFRNVNTKKCFILYITRQLRRVKLSDRGWKPALLRLNTESRVSY